MSTRTPSEIAILKAEAERRVRAGESHTDVARALRVPPSTLGYWASDGMWRRKDLDFQVDEARGRAALASIAESAARDLNAVRERGEKARQLAEAARKAIEAADPDGEGRPSALTRPPVSARQLSMAMAHSLLEQGRLDEAERAARFSLRFAQAEQANVDHESEQWRADRARILKWWETTRAGVFSLQARAKEMSAELESIRRFEEEMTDQECCPTCVRPMEFWPAAMDQKMDRLREEAELNDTVAIESLKTGDGFALYREMRDRMSGATNWEMNEGMWTDEKMEAASDRT